MTTATPTRPLPPHGTYGRYVGRPHTRTPGCRCEPCVTAMRVYSRRRGLLAATGRSLTVDASPVTERLRRLRAAGAGWNQLVAATGCSTSTLSALLHGTRPTIRRTTAQRLLTVRLAEVICPGRSVPALGSIRRVRALVAAGHGVEQIAAECGIEQTTVSYLLGGRLDTIRATTHQAVDEAFERLALVVGNSARSRRRAAAARWAPPLAWDDPDDPDEQPQYGKRTPRPAAIVEDTAELVGQGWSREAIAQRLGLTWDAVCVYHSRLGVPVPEFAS